VDQTQARRWLEIEARLLAAYPDLTDYENVLITAQRVQDPSGDRDDDDLSVDELSFLRRVRLQQELERPLPAQRGSAPDIAADGASRRH